MLLKTISLVLTSVLFLNSCGNSRWSEAKVAALPSVNVGLPTKSKGAYHKPLKLSNRSQSAANNAAFSTGNAGGFIGAAVGTAIISGIIIADQKRFESNSAAQISCIESLIDHRLEDSYAIQLIKSLKQQPFFQQRFNNQSPYRIQTEIKSYGLTREGEDEPMRFHATVNCQTNLKGVADMALLKNVMVSGSSTTVGTLDQFAADKARLNMAFREASCAAASDLSQQLQEQTAASKP